MFRFLIRSVLVACVFGNGLLPRFLSPTSRIIGGNDTTIENHPYQISVRGPDGDHGCGGSIIGSRKVLTAAHCCEPSMLLTIQYGITKRGTNENVISVAKLIRHPNYDSHTVTHDICVLLLSEDIPFSNSSKPIKLAEEEPIAGAKAVVTGWGYLNLGGPKATILQEAELKIIDRETCKLSYKKVNNVDKSMVCAGVKGYGKDCSTDSGGPLVSDGKLVGVISWSLKCGQMGHPGVYANVAGLRDWIESQ